MITCYTATVLLTRKYRMTMTFCSPRDQSTGRETCSAGMVSDQLLGTRQSEKRGKMGDKWGEKWKSGIGTGWEEKQSKNANHRCIFKSTMILLHEAEETDRDKNNCQTDFVFVWFKRDWWSKCQRSHFWYIWLTKKHNISC